MDNLTQFTKIEQTAGRRNTVLRVITYVMLTLWALVVLFPFYWMLLTSVKSYSSYNAEHIPGALRVDWEDLEKNIASILLGLSFTPAWIILYCDHGNTSLLTARDLARNGYPVISLNGGFAYWKSYQSHKAAT